MKIRVTSSDIEHGQRRDPENCPVARALRRAGVHHLGVGGMGVMVGTHRDHMMVLLPGLVQDWIAQFDWGKPVNPFEFEMIVPDLPDEVVKRAQPVEKPAISKAFSPPARGMTPVSEEVEELAGV